MKKRGPVVGGLGVKQLITLTVRAAGVSRRQVKHIAKCSKNITIFKKNISISKQNIQLLNFITIYLESPSVQTYTKYWLSKLWNRLLGKLWKQKSILNDEIKGCVLRVNIFIHRSLDKILELQFILFYGLMLLERWGEMYCFSFLFAN